MSKNDLYKIKKSKDKRDNKSCVATGYKDKRGWMIFEGDILEPYMRMSQQDFVVMKNEEGEWIGAFHGHVDCNTLLSELVKNNDKPYGMVIMNRVSVKDVIAGNYHYE
jgi:hypothetical protein